MRTYLVCYDLADPAINKADVVAAIMMVGSSWARPLDNVWYVRTDVDQEQIESDLRPAVSAEDGLVIQAVRETAVLMNTSLRWFRQRRIETGETTPADNVVPFPGSAPANDVGDCEIVRVAS